MSIRQSTDQDGVGFDLFESVMELLFLVIRRVSDSLLDCQDGLLGLAEKIIQHSQGIESIRAGCEFDGFTGEYESFFDI
ncbi:hypothetical protein JXQ70_10265 [bacterium]|nr:hypothetical protein [bacterium]